MLTGVDVVDPRTAQKAAQALRDKGAATGVVKLGERGVSYSSAIGQRPTSTPTRSMP